MDTSSKTARFFVNISLALSYLLSAGKTFRWPNDWAEAHWLLSYSFGFIKRALPGTILSLTTKAIGINKVSEASIRMVSLGMFSIFTLLLFWMVYRLLESTGYQLSSVLISLVFLTSPYVVMSAHIMGYFDNIVIIFSTTAALLLLKRKAFMAALVLCLSTLIHETTLIVTYPCILLIALVNLLKSKPYDKLRDLLSDFWARYWYLVLAPILTFLLIVSFQTLFIDQESLKYAVYRYLSQFSYVGENRNHIVPATLTTTIGKYWSSQHVYFASRIANPIHALEIGMPFYLLSIFAWFKLEGFRFRNTLFSVLILISLAPLSLHLIAWDTSRIWTYPIMIIFLAIWGINEGHTMPSRSLGALLQLSCVIVIVFQVIMQVPLMDNEWERFTIAQRILFYTPFFLLIALIYRKNWQRPRIGR